jgi:hypothetical protein
MDASLSLLARFDAQDRQRDIAGERLAQELFHRQVAEKVTAHPIEWHDSSAIVLRIQNKQAHTAPTSFLLMAEISHRSTGNSAAPTGRAIG